MKEMNTEKQAEEEDRQCEASWNQFKTGGILRSKLRISKL
jgi:hypothetical protein